MGTIAPDLEARGSEVYSSLGLIELAKVPGCQPRVLSVLSSLLERSVQKNEKLLGTTQKKDSVTIFHGLRAPSLSIRQYVDRIFKYSSCSPSCFVVAYIYIERFIQRTDVHLSSLNVHRLVITSVMVAAKFIDDAFYNNAYYAKVGGVSTAEMNSLETKFLFSLDFRLHVTVGTFDRYCLQLEKEASGGYQIERPIQICGLKESWPNKDEPKHAAALARYSC
ncbi:cyclin-P3-1 [Macadamia integrifolia]|uniref:cyclin-P3-1 n=1 Tax=Macadamia integrifolia TaxID=60698 RepID=UPI001C4FB882|nr:cyclin-P3-1 [Macadamia integrifolia]XP_042517757.1 cyclin-P3-1 [Macadamia integrifolia]